MINHKISIAANPIQWGCCCANPTTICDISLRLGLPSNPMPLQSTCSKDLQSPSSNNVKVISSTPTMLEQRVASWLDSLPNEYLPSEALSKTSKRKAALPSPPTSDSMEGTTPKRR